MSSTDGYVLKCNEKKRRERDMAQRFMNALGWHSKLVCGESPDFTFCRDEAEIIPNGNNDIGLELTEYHKDAAADHGSKKMGAIVAWRRIQDEFETAQIQSKLVTPRIILLKTRDLSAPNRRNAAAFCQELAALLAAHTTETDGALIRIPAEQALLSKYLLWLRVCEPSAAVSSLEIPELQGGSYGLQPDELITRINDKNEAAKRYSRGAGLVLVIHDTDTSPALGLQKDIAKLKASDDLAACLEETPFDEIYFMAGRGKYIQILRILPAPYELVIDEPSSKSQSHLPHLDRLTIIEWGTHIDEIHGLLCKQGDDDLVEISKLVTELYTIAESEREPEHREQRLITDYAERADWKQAFFINHEALPEYRKVEHHFFLNLLYSISFSLRLVVNNRSQYHNSHSNLEQRGYFLECAEDLYVVLDTLALMVTLVCGIPPTDFGKNKHFPGCISYPSLARAIRGSPFEENYRFLHKGPNFELLRGLRDAKAHRPFLDWPNGCMVSERHDLLRVSTYCESHQLFSIRVSDFLEGSFREVLKVVQTGLEGILVTYSKRFEYESTKAKEAERACFQAAHKEWSRILAVMPPEPRP